tara:strand:+ start:137 stop:640 length:504 start_codon:yes stop_codon:yes gene_type:complete
MIITCINCNKKFEVNSDLIPQNGREIICGSCNHTWFYKKDTIEDYQISDKSFLNEKKVIDSEIPKVTESIIKEAEKNTFKLKNIENSKNLNTNGDKEPVKKYTKKDGNLLINFFSYLIVGIMSFIGLIILLDTFKQPLIEIYPKLEIFLYSLYETLKDVELFIIDLI